MAFRSNRSTSVFGGVAAGFIGVCNLLMFAAFADQGAPSFLSLLGALLILVSLACFTFTNVVTIDRQKIEKTTGVLFWKRTQSYPPSNFRGVGITTGGRGGRHSRPTVIYFVQLLGSTNLSVPPRSADYDGVLFKAKRIAGFLNLPLDEDPKMGFFGKRL